MRQIQDYFSRFIFPIKIKTQKNSICFQYIEKLFGFCLLLCFLLIGAPAYSEAPINISNLVQKIPREDREKLDFFFRKLIIDHAFGYTLFGEKPIVFETFPNYTILNRRLSYLPLNEGWKIWEKYRNFFPSNCFIFERVQDCFNCKEPTIILINLKTGNPLVKQTKNLFTNDFLVRRADDSSRIPEKVYQLIKSPTYSSEYHLKLGFLLGFGKNNTIRFSRMNEIFHALVELPYFPQKIPEEFNLLSEEMKEHVFFQKLYSESNPLKKTDENLAQIIQEYNDLTKEWKSLSHLHPDGPMTLICLPTFIADNKFSETEELYQSYAKTRKQLMRILQEPNFLEIILTRYCEGT
jgi:hypothetical protein